MCHVPRKAAAARCNVASYTLQSGFSAACNTLIGEHAYNCTCTIFIDPHLGLMSMSPYVLLQNLNQPAITKLLDRCLLSDKELASGKTAEQWIEEDPLFGNA